MEITQPEPNEADVMSRTEESAADSSGAGDDTTPLATQDGVRKTVAKPPAQGNTGDEPSETASAIEPNSSGPTSQCSNSEAERRSSDKVWHGHQSLSLEGYLSHYQQRSPSRRPFALIGAGSTQSSSGSLQALSEHEGEDTTLKRAHSARSTHSRNRGRSVSQSKVLPLTQPGTKRQSYGDSFYPDQSFAQLSNPVLGARPHPVLRTRSSHPAQNLLYNDMAKPNVTPPHSRRTADNTPMSSPGLFSPSAVRQATLDSNRSGSPSLHHLQAPKETHTAEIEHDVYSGNKFINNYEIVTELGRGEHGKVKLGRDIERDNMVAIKIVPRYSAKRRLGKLGAPEDRTKREVAILKKARHPNVVSLLEVIDDPNKNKVYLILEFVDRGEIKWRKSGVKEILAINNIRFEQERLGAQLGVDPTDRDHHIVRQAQIRHERLEQLRATHKDLNHIPNWSLEYAGDTDDESDMLELSRTISRQMTKDSVPSRGNSQDDYVGLYEPALSGSMYGAYAPDAYRSRKFSVAASAISHMSSDIGFELDDDQHSYVPALTIEEAQGAFRDTLVGLEFLHFIGIIHRDIKPANLLSSSSHMVKISDFGVSYLGRPENEEESEEKSKDQVVAVDTEKELARSVGTPAFWAPELCYEDATMFEDGKEPKITGALDLWALGITLYCMIYARLPFYSSDDMGLHEAICTANVFCPRTRLVPVDTTHSDFVSRSKVPINGNKRLDYELKFEAVPEDLRDLISRLLIKDPAKRITIADAKRHPWVIEGVANHNQWLQGPIEKEGKKKILDINERELSHAVVKRNIIERALSTAGRLAGSLLGRKDGRKRASSAATSAGSSTESLHSPSGSTASTIGRGERSREGRRTSLRGDEFVQALKSSREPTEHHPLAQSQTASPEIKDVPSYFAAHNSVSAGATPAELERRPPGPDRAISALSTADSVKTIRPQRPRLDEAINSEPSFRSKFEGLWEGTTKSLAKLASRDGQSSSRSRSTSRPASESDGHTGPSLAVSNTHASGSISKPDELKEAEASASAWRAVSPESPMHATIHAPTSSDEDFEQAQQINQRRHLQEIQDKIDTVDKRVSQPIAEDCPPSPDDITFFEKSEPISEQSPLSEGAAMQTAVSASTIASSVDGFGDGSMSDPSFGIASGASSPPEGFLSAEYKDLQNTSHTANEPDFMRTADTITMHAGIPTASAKALEEQHEHYNGDNDDDDDSDEEGIVMGGLRRG